MQCLKRYWSILPTKVSAFYIFALVASSCYSLLQKPCNRCNHCVTASQYNTLRQHVTTCKKTFGEQKVGGSNPSGRTNAKEIPLRYLFCVEVLEAESARGVRIRVYYLSHTRKTAVKDAVGADAVGRRFLTAGLSLRAHLISGKKTTCITQVIRVSLGQEERCSSASNSTRYGVAA